MLRRLVHGRSSGLLGPSLLVAGAALVLVGGAHHFENGWPGTGGNPWANQGFVPGGVAAFAWAATLSLSSYWAHPASLLGFPTAELAWMAASPAALAGTVLGTCRIVRRLDASPRLVRYELRLATAASATTAVALLSASVWVVGGTPGPRNLFHAGAVDAAGLVAMVILLGLALVAIRHARQAAAVAGSPSAGAGGRR